MSSSKKDQPYTSQLRGVSALLGNSNLQPEPSSSQLIAIKSIHLPKQQPRRYFDPGKLEQLALSVKEHGIIEPLLVRPLPDGGYELVAGERRYRASQLTGLTEVPVVIRHLNDEESLQLALVENLQREDLNPVEETEGILQLVALRLQTTVEEATLLLYRMQNEAKGKVTQNVLGKSEGQSIRDVFEALSSISWESFVSSRLPLLKMPEEILEALRQGKIAYTKAQAIARVKDGLHRKALLDEATAQDLSLVQIKEQIAQLKAASTDSNALPSVRTRINQLLSQLKKSKALDDPKKQKQLEKVLAALESLTSEES